MIMAMMMVMIMGILIMMMLIMITDFGFKPISTFFNHITVTSSP